MSKKRLLAMLFAVVIIVVIGVLAGVVFVVRDVDININDGEGMENEISVEDILEAANIQKGKSIFSISESKVVSNIESQFPTLRVKGVERVFPNKIIISLVERIPLIAIKFKDKNEYLVLDNNMCVITKIEYTSDEERDEKLKDYCVVKGTELEGARQIYYGKTLPRIYGDEVVMVENIVSGLIDSGMNLTQVKEFLDGISFDKSEKTVFVETKYSTKSGVTIMFSYKGIDKDTKLVYKRVMEAREFYINLETSQKASGYLKYNEENDEFYYDMHLK